MDTGAFERLVREQKDRIFGYVWSMLKNRAEAQDVAQEVMVRLWNHRESVDFDRARAWMMRTAHNLCVDRTRRKRTRAESPGDELFDATAHDDPGPDHEAESRQLGEILMDALARLTDEHREVVVLREVQGMSYEEIASTVGAPLGTVKARLHRAREQLRVALARQGVTP